MAIDVIVEGELAKEMIKEMQNGDEGQYVSIIGGGDAVWVQRLASILVNIYENESQLRDTVLNPKSPRSRNANNHTA